MSLSNAHRNVISIISMANGAAIQIERDYKARPRNKTIMPLIQNVIEASKAAFDVYPEIPLSQVPELADRMKRLEILSFDGAIKEDPVAYLSFVLGLQSDLLELVKDPVRYEAIDRMHDATWRLFRYFDPMGKRHLDHERGGKAIKVWYRLNNQ